MRSFWASRSQPNERPTMSKKLWIEVLETVREKQDIKAVAIKLWLQPVKGEIPLNGAGFPLGRPLRWVARELERLGYKNGKGQPYHPYQLQQEIIFDGLTDILVERSREIVRDALIEGCKQKVTYHREVSDPEVYVYEK